ncbi:MAG: response regulator [Chloroflexi bacterium]|nr:MAG: response regulator [Chloroflexota bacterium]
MNQTKLSHRSSRVRILVVDDHAGTATTLARALAQLGPGVEVIPATSGEEALERVKHAAADILITDMIMSEMTGLELIEKLQNHPSGRPAFCFLITAYDVPGLKASAHRLNVKEVFTKPVNPERICQIVAQAMEKIDQAKPAPKETVLKKVFTILIADDKPDNLLLLARYLESEGYKYIEARDGLETLEKVRSTMPDLVLLDINMPHKDGFAVLEEIRADPAIQHIPVIILTAARLDSIEVQFGLNLGADDYITKPFDRRELLARIRTKLRTKDSEDVTRQCLAAVLQSTADAILVFDAQARLSRINPAGQKLFTAGEAKLGQPLPSDAGYDSLLQLLDRTRLPNASFSGEVVWPNKRLFSASATPLQEGGLVVALHDETLFKDVERIKNEFIATASRNLRNPITSIKGFNRLIKLAGPLNEQQLNFIQRIQNTAENMWWLVENMLDLAKMDLAVRYTHEAIDINLLISEMVDEFQASAETSGQILTFEKTETSLEVRGEALRLRQALRNLVSNAIKYTPIEGTIILSLEKQTGEVWIHIQDNGYGISPADLPFIFDRFYRAQNEDTRDIEGNGLGLAIVKSIVEQHGGQIRVQSERGKGSCFTIALPLVKAGLSPVETVDLSKPHPGLIPGQGFTG